MRTVLLSANLGEFDKYHPPVPQSMANFEAHCFTEKDFPPRYQSMTPRLQARIPKMFGWDMRPGYDLYLWLDASFRLADRGAARWFEQRLDYCDFAFFLHPQRSTIKEEAAYIAQKIADGSQYLISRYASEDLSGQLRAVTNRDYVDDTLYASMAFCYRPKPRVKQLLTSWWVHTSRFHSVDQLALPYLLWDHGCSVAVLEGDPYYSPYIEFTRKRTVPHA